MTPVKRLFLLAAAAAVFALAGCHGRRMFCRDSDSSSYDACR
jgi:ABC-type phosphate/phosphonate transport system substrate-binding protein